MSVFENKLSQKRLSSPILKQVSRVQLHQEEVYEFVIVKLDDGKRRIISCSRDNKIAIYHEKLGTHIITHDQPLYSICHYPEYNVILTTDWAGKLCIWNLWNLDFKKINEFQISEDESILWNLKRISETHFCCCCTRGNSKGHVYTVEVKKEEGSGFSCSVKTLFVQKRSGKKEAVQCIYQLKSQNEHLVFAGGGLEKQNGDFAIKKCNWKTGKLVEIFQQKHSDRVNALTSIFKSNGKEERLVSGGEDFRVILWTLSGECLKTLRCDEMVNCFLNFDLYTSPYLLLCGFFGHFDFGFRGVLYFLNTDFEHNEEETEIVGLKKIHDDEIRCIRWLEDENEPKEEENENETRTRRLVTCSEDGSISIHELNLSDCYKFPIQHFKLRKTLDRVHSEWIGDVIVVNEPEKNLFLVVSCSDDKYVKVFDERAGRVICEARHESEMYKISYLKSKKVLIAIDSQGSLVFWKLDLSVESSRKVFCSSTYCSLVKLGEFSIGSFRNYFEKLIPSRNLQELRLVTCCYDGTVNKGEVIEVLFDVGKDEEDGTEKIVNFKKRILSKFEEDVNAVYFSKLHANILYFGGGDYEYGKDLDLKKYDFSSVSMFGNKERGLMEKKFLKGVNKSPILSIASVLRSSNSLSGFVKQEEDDYRMKELLIVGNNNGDIYFFYNEEWVKHLSSNIYGESASNILPINKNIVLVGGGCNNEYKTTGNVFLLDLSSPGLDMTNNRYYFLSRKLTYSEGEHKGWIIGLVYVKNEKKLITYSGASGIKMFDMFSTQDCMVLEDERERMHYLVNKVLVGENKGVVLEARLFGRAGRQSVRLFRSFCL